MLPEKDSMEKSIETLIEETCDEIKNMLLTKNKAYGNSVHENGPLFKIEPIIGIQARINDKLNRIKNKGINLDTEDSVEDLIGYFIHYKIAKKVKDQKIIF